MTLLAHIGHWYHAVLYLVPVLIVGGGLWWAGRHLPEEGDDAFDDADDDRRDGPRPEDARGVS
ncbi:hypothetical protein [Patulibacter americanus]|uniref:hypothetical protein n=1 Tax=Patulibacter americanus TaxID=588672 RepID=UPI000420905B|nr:hypothetical protein [Patulibacter americanus]